MRTRLIRICIIALMTYIVYGCGGTKEAAAAEEEICYAAEGCLALVRSCAVEAWALKDAPEIRRSQDRLSVRIADDAEYAWFIDALQWYPDCRRLDIGLEGTDTTVCPDEIAAVLDLEYLYIGNGGHIAYRNVPTLTYSVDELKLDHVRSVDKSLTEAVLSGSLRIRDTLTIALDESYTGADALPAALLEEAACPNVSLLWDGKNGALCDAVKDMEALAEWEHIQAVQKTTAGSLQCIYRLDEDGRRYISYEFYETTEGGRSLLADAFISVRDICGGAGAACDIIAFPADRLGERYGGVSKGTGRRLSASEDLNFDGSRDLVFDGDNTGASAGGVYTVFLWSEEEGRYIWAKDAPAWYDRIDRDRQRLWSRSHLSAGDEDYQIYEYRDGAFREKHLEIRTKAADAWGFHWDVTGQYYRDGTLEARLEMIYGEDGARHFFYEQIGSGRGREELRIAGDLTYEDVSRIIFPEFDFYWQG